MPSLTINELEYQFLASQLGALALPNDTINDLRSKFYSNPPSRSGTGSPEGVVAAPVGTTYNDTSSAVGASVWTKKSGTGNTGWVVTSGDTDWRTITSWNAAGAITGQALTASWGPVSGAAGAVRVRRINNVVYIGFRNLTRIDTTAIGIWAAYVLPVGFRPSVYAEGVFHTATGPTVMWLGTDGSIGRGTGTKSGANGDLAGTAESLIIGFTADAWPTALPGF